MDSMLGAHLCWAWLVIFYLERRIKDKTKRAVFQANFSTKLITSKSGDRKIAERKGSYTRTPHPLFISLAHISLPHTYPSISLLLTHIPPVSLSRSPPDARHKPPFISLPLSLTYASLTLSRRTQTLSLSLTYTHPSLYTCQSLSLPLLLHTHTHPYLFALAQHSPSLSLSLSLSLLILENISHLSPEEHNLSLSLSLDLGEHIVSFSRGIQPISLSLSLSQTLSTACSVGQCTSKVLRADTIPLLNRLLNYNTSRSEVYGSRNRGHRSNPIIFIAQTLAT